MIDEKIEALFAAINSGDDEKAIEIIDADPALVDSFSAGVSPIRAAIYRGNRDLANKVAERAVHLTLHDAAALGRAGQLKHLEGDVNGFSQDGFTPLTLACAFGNRESVDALIGLGADIELFSTNPNIQVAPMHAAAFGGNSEAIEALIEAGASVNLLAEGGFTALHSAAQNGDIKSAKLLIDAEANTSLATSEGKTATDYAREGRHLELAELIDRAN